MGILELLRGACPSLHSLLQTVVACSYFISLANLFDCFPLL